MSFFRQSWITNRTQLQERLIHWYSPFIKLNIEKGALRNYNEWSVMYWFDRYRLTLHSGLTEPSFRAERDTPKGVSGGSHFWRLPSYAHTTLQFGVNEWKPWALIRDIHDGRPVFSINPTTFNIINQREKAIKASCEWLSNLLCVIITVDTISNL